MAAPVFQAIGTAAGTTGGAGASTPTLPAHLTDDIILLFVSTDGADPAPTAAGIGNGYAEAPSSPVVNAGTASRLSIFWKRATSGAETNPSVPDPGNYCWAQVLTVRGAITTGSPFVTSNSTSGSASTWQLSGMTVPVTDTFIVHSVGWGIDNAGPLAGTITNSSGLVLSLTERYDGGTIDGNGGGLYVATGSLNSACVFTANSVSATNSAYASISLAMYAATSVASPLLPTFFGNGSVAASATVDIQPPSTTVSGGTLVNDVEILVVETPAGVAANLSDAQGFVALASSPQDSNGGSNPTRLTAYWRRITALPTVAPTVTFVSDHVIGAIYTFRNCDRGATPIDAENGDVLASNSSTVTSPSVTTTTTSTLIAHFTADGADNLVNNVTGPTNAALDNLTIRTAARNLAGNGGGITCYTGTKASSGSTGNSIATFTSGSTNQARITVAFKGIAATLDPGSVPITGTAATLTRQRLVDASPGAVAITGTNANLLYNRALVATPGDVPITGTAASLIVQGRVIDMLPGSVPILAPSLVEITLNQAAPVVPSEALQKSLQEHVIILRRNTTIIRR